MPGHDGELGRARPHGPVLVQAHRDLPRALSAAALAAELDRALALEELLGDLRHALVHLTEQGLVCAEPLLAYAHRDNSLPHAAGWQGLKRLDREGGVFSQQ